MASIGERDMRFDLCPLCSESADLQSSHIIPSFVFQWLRDSGGTGHIRFSGRPNVRVQDGWKPRMLCAACEQRFGTWEKAFAENCFVPILEGKVSKIKYQAWMLKFATSVSWRVLRTFKAINALADFPPDLIAAADTALDEWAQFLMNKRPHPGPHEQHLLLVDGIQSSTITNMPPNINRYLLRAIEMHVAWTPTSAITYAKMGRFILFGFIQIPHPRQWKGTKLSANEGRFGVGHVTLPGNIGPFIMDRARRMAARYAEISDKQRSKMEESFLRDVDRVADSESFRALHQDVLLFGDEAFEIMRQRES